MDHFLDGIESNFLALQFDKKLWWSFMIEVRWIVFKLLHTMNLQDGRAVFFFKFQPSLLFRPQLWSSFMFYFFANVWHYFSHPLMAKLFYLQKLFIKLNSKAPPILHRNFQGIAESNSFDKPDYCNSNSANNTCERGIHLASSKSKKPKDIFSQWNDVQKAKR